MNLAFADVIIDARTVFRDGWRGSHRATNGYLLLLLLHIAVAHSPTQASFRTAPIDEHGAPMATSTRLCYAEVSQDRYKRPTSQRCCVNFKGFERAADVSWHGSLTQSRRRASSIYSASM